MRTTAQVVERQGAARKSTQLPQPRALAVSAGLGEIPVHYDIVRARDERLVPTSSIQRIRFDRRTQLIQLATNFEGVTFEEPGVYLVQLFCDNTRVADVALEVLEDQ